MLYLPHLNHLNDSITGHQGCYILCVVIHTLPHTLFFSYTVLHSLSHYKQTLVIYTLAAIVFAIISNSIKIKDVTMYKITQNIKTQNKVGFGHLEEVQRTLQHLTFTEHIIFSIKHGQDVKYHKIKSRCRSLAVPMWMSSATSYNFSQECYSFSFKLVSSHNSD